MAKSASRLFSVALLFMYHVLFLIITVMRPKNFASAAFSASPPSSSSTVPPRTNNYHQPQQPQQVERMTVAEYRRRRQQPSFSPLELDRPILIRDALPLEECEALCDLLLQAVDGSMIPIQRKQNGETILYECTMEQALDLILHSQPNDTYFAFVEGLLNNNNNNKLLESIQQKVIQVREQLFDEENWFDYFPSNARPSDCIIMAGEGATSTLHRDPFEWTGTSLCLEGRKLWRFLPAPFGGDDDYDYDDLLESYRLDSIAWEQDDTSSGSVGSGSSNAPPPPMVLSAGWQSDFTLYEPVRKESLPSAQYIAEEMSEEESEALQLEAVSTRNFLQPNNIHPAVVDFASVVQHPGEMLLIPPYQYHQTYAPEPSLAIASQRCGTSLDAPRVVKHMLDLLVQGQKRRRREKGSNKYDYDDETLPPEIKSILLRGQRQQQQGASYSKDEQYYDPKNVSPEKTVKVLFEYLQQL